MTNFNKTKLASLLALTIASSLSTGCDYMGEEPIVAGSDVLSINDANASESSSDEQPVFEIELDSDIEDIAEPPAPEEEPQEEKSEVAAFASSSSSSWSRWFSEENPPVTCFTGGLVSGARCRGRFCDKLSIRCRRSPVGTPSRRVWRGYFSEENRSYRYCPAQHWMTGLACQGAFCDNIAIECTKMGVTGRDCRWGSWFSEEDPAMNLGGNRFVRGVQCSGMFCDNKRYYSCAIR